MDSQSEGTCKKTEGKKQTQVQEECLLEDGKNGKITVERPAPRLREMSNMVMTKMITT